MITATVPLNPASTTKIASESLLLWPQGYGDMLQQQLRHYLWSATVQWVGGYIIIIIIAATAHRHRSFTIQSSHGRASVVIEINYFRLVIGEPRLVLVMLCWASMSVRISSEDYTLFGCVCCRWWWWLLVWIHYTPYWLS